MAITTPTSLYHTTNTGTQFHYLQSGNQTGPLLLCLHGLGGSIDTYKPLLPYLPSDYNTLLVDFPGFGKSPFSASANTISIAHHVADLDNFITALQRPSQPRGVVIIGHSLGAIVALQYAALCPETVNGLALLGAGRSAAGIPAAKQRMLDLAAAVREKGVAVAADLATKSNFYEPTSEREADPKALEAVRNAVLAADPEAYARTCEALVDPAHKDPRYELITAPAVFVAGDKDMISPVERSRDLSTLVGGKSWVEVVKSGHQPILEDILGVRSALQKLFETIDTA